MGLLEEEQARLSDYSWGRQAQRAGGGLTGGR